VRTIVDEACEIMECGLAKDAVEALELLDMGVSPLHNGAGDRYDVGGKNYVAVHKSPTTINLSTSGKADAFPTMPPYVALFYCKKD
jgi:hypothetical protein